MVLHNEVLAVSLNDLGNGFRRIGYRHTGIEEIHALVKGSAEDPLDFIQWYILITIVADTNADGADLLSIS